VPRVIVRNAVWQSVKLQKLALLTTREIATPVLPQRDGLAGFIVFKGWLGQHATASRDFHVRRNAEQHDRIEHEPDRQECPAAKPRNVNAARRDSDRLRNLMDWELENIHQPRRRSMANDVDKPQVQKRAEECRVRYLPQ